MPEIADEVLFERFRSKGDVHALGELFDRRATELFRLALYLGHDAAEAEDLVQATFLSALENARNYDRQRPLLPWLTGILTNQAKKSWRQHRREIVPDLLTQKDVPGPDLEAEYQEVRASLAVALKALPQPYRRVLTLHLEHGLTARAIGELLERPAGTVRSQVVRGLEMLRQTLPTGLVGGLALLLTPGHALAGVRAEVLRAADHVAPAPNPQPQPAGAESTLWGATPKLVTVALGLTLLVGIPLGLAYTGNAEASPPEEVDQAQAAPNSALQTTSQPLRQTSEASRRQEAAVSNPAGTLAVRLLGPDGNPVTDIPCQLVALQSGTNQLLWNSILSRQPLLRSDDNGWLRAKDLPPGTYAVRLAGTLERLDLQLPAEAQDWRIPDLRQVTGSVRKQDGTPAVAASVYCSETIGTHEQSPAIATTDAQGAFAFWTVKTPTFVWSTSPGLAASAAVKATDNARIDLELGGPATPVTVTARERSGEPAPDTVIGAFPFMTRSQLRAPRFAVTDTDGRAEIVGMGAGPFVVVASSHNGWSRRRTVEAFAGTPCEIEVTLQPMASVHGRVVDANGAPLADRAVFAQTTSTRPLSFDNALHSQLARTDADGRYALSRLSSEPTRLRLVTDSNNQELSQRTITLSPGERGSLDFRVDVQQLSGRVRDLTDNAEANWIVKAIPLGPDESLGNLQYFSGRTDAQGRFRIEVSDRFDRFRLFAAPATCDKPQFLHRAVMDAAPTQSPLHMVSRHPDGPGARGRILLPPGTTADEVSAKLLRGRLSSPLTVSEAGAFDTGPLPADRYRIAVSSADMGTMILPLRTLPRASSESPVELGEIAWPSPGMLSVLPVDPRGLPVPAQIWLTDNDGNWIDAVEAATPKAVAPGTWWLCAAGPLMPPQRQRLAIASGEVLSRELRAPTSVPCHLEFPFESIDNVVDLQVELQILLQDDQGQALMQTSLGPEPDERFLWIQRLQPGNYRLACSTEWGGHVETTLTVRGDESVFSRSFPLKTARDPR